MRLESYPHHSDVIFPGVNNLPGEGPSFLVIPIYLVGMDKRYVTLQTLANIVRETPHPTQYLCTPREMILHSIFDWDLIHKHLSLLATEELVCMIQADTLQFVITEKGLSQANASIEPVDDKLILSLRNEPVKS